jgi:hypothetical protein
MYAGAPSVIASLWSVDDAATQQLMVAFYERLTHGIWARPRRSERPKWKSGNNIEIIEILTMSFTMVRPERRAGLPGASPVRVSAGAPGSRLQPSGEIRPRQKPLKERGANRRAATISERNGLVKLSAERCLGGAQIAEERIGKLPSQPADETNWLIAGFPSCGGHGR